MPIYLKDLPVSPLSELLKNPSLSSSQLGIEGERIWLEKPYTVFLANAWMAGYLHGKAVAYEDSLGKRKKRQNEIPEIEILKAEKRHSSNYADLAVRSFKKLMEDTNFFQDFADLEQLTSLLNFEWFFLNGDVMQGATLKNWVNYETVKPSVLDFINRMNSKKNSSVLFGFSENSQNLDFFNSFPLAARHAYLDEVFTFEQATHIVDSYYSSENATNEEKHSESESESEQFMRDLNGFTHAGAIFEKLLLTERSKVSKITWEVMRNPIGNPVYEALKRNKQYLKRLALYYWLTIRLPISSDTSKTSFNAFFQGNPWSMGFEALTSNELKDTYFSWVQRLSRNEKMANISEEEWTMYYEIMADPETSYGHYYKTEGPNDKKFSKRAERELDAVLNKFFKINQSDFSKFYQMIYPDTMNCHTREPVVAVCLDESSDSDNSFECSSDVNSAVLQSGDIIVNSPMGRKLLQQSSDRHLVLVAETLHLCVQLEVAVSQEALCITHSPNSFEQETQRKKDAGIHFINYRQSIMKGVNKLLDLNMLENNTDNFHDDLGNGIIGDKQIHTIIYEHGQKENSDSADDYFKINLEIRRRLAEIRGHVQQTYYVFSARTLREYLWFSVDVRELKDVLYYILKNPNDSTVVDIMKTGDEQSLYQLIYDYMLVNNLVTSKLFDNAKGTNIYFGDQIEKLEIFCERHKKVKVYSKKAEFSFIDSYKRQAYIKSIKCFYQSEFLTHNAASENTRYDYARETVRESDDKAGIFSDESHKSFVATFFNQSDVVDSERYQLNVKELIFRNVLSSSSSISFPETPQDANKNKKGELIGQITKMRLWSQIIYLDIIRNTNDTILGTIFQTPTGKHAVDATRGNFKEIDRRYKQTHRELMAWFVELYRNDFPALFAQHPQLFDKTKKPEEGLRRESIFNNLRSSFFGDSSVTPVTIASSAPRV